MFKGEMDALKIIFSIVLISLILVISIIAIKPASKVSDEQTLSGYMTSCCTKYISNKCCFEDSDACRDMLCTVEDGTMTITELATQIGTTPQERCC